jgi:hypothetical protein
MSVQPDLLSMVHPYQTDKPGLEIGRVNQHRVRGTLNTPPRETPDRGLPVDR